MTKIMRLFLKFLFIFLIIGSTPSNIKAARMDLYTNSESLPNPISPLVAKVGEYTTSVYGIALQNNILLVATANSLLLLDIQNNSQPKLLSEFGKGRRILAVQTYENTVFFSEEDQGVFVLDITDPRAPRQIRQLLSGPSSTMQVEGKQLYITIGRTDSVIIFDLKNSSNPTQIGTYTGTGGQISIYGFYVKTKLMFVHGTYSSSPSTQLIWEIVDVTNPAQPRRLNFTSEGGGLTQATAAFAFTTEGDKFGRNVKVIDISNPSNLKIVARFGYAEYISAMLLNDNLLVVGVSENSRQENRLVFFDVSNPVNPVPSSFYKTTKLQLQAYQLLLNNGYLYVAEVGGGIEIFSITSPKFSHFVHLPIVREGVHPVHPTVVLG